MKNLNWIEKAIVIIYVFIFLIWAYIANEPIIYAYTGFGFVWDYNPDFEPILFRK